LNRAKYIEKLDVLRSQIRKDSVIGAELYQKQLAEAYQHIDDLAAYELVIPEMSKVLPTLTQSVKSFYSTESNRGWAQQFALQDIQKLEELYRAEGE